MATITGTITGVSELRAKTHPGRKAYHVTASFGAFNSGADTAQLTTVGATILAYTRNGKAVTLRGAVPIAAGKDTAALDVYLTGASVVALTVSSDSLTGQLSNAAGTIQTSAACTGVELCVIVDEA